MNHAMNDESHYIPMLDCGSEYKHMEADDVVSSISYGSYSGAYYMPGARTNKLAVYGEEMLPDLPPEDAESLLDGSVSGYGAASHYDSQSMYQDGTYSGHNVP